jgi:hypothetical protein
MAATRQTPRISVNALAKYLAASSSGARRKIIKDQKHPEEYMIRRYDPATKGIVAFLIDPDRNEKTLIALKDKLDGQKPKNRNERTTLRINVEAIVAFLKGFDKLTLDGLILARGPNSAHKLTIEGVQISVRPEILISGIAKGGPFSAALKLYFAKNGGLNEDSAAFLGALLGRHVEESEGPNASVSKSHCQIMDVFRSTVFQSPKATKKRFKEIEAACAEIRSGWVDL